MDEKTIKETLLKGERVTLECKKAKAEMPKSIWQTYSAFANTIGGMILLGVDEDLQENDICKRFSVLGVNEPRKIITDFWNTINSDRYQDFINRAKLFESVCKIGSRVEGIRDLPFFELVEQD